MKQQTNGYKRIATLLAMSMLLIALPVQASSGTGSSQRAATGNVISETGATSVELVPPRSESKFYLEEIPFKVTTKGKSAPEQTYEVVFERKDASNPMPKVTDGVTADSNGNLHYTIKTPAVGSEESVTVNALIGMIEFDKEGEYTYTLSLRSGNDRFVTYDKSVYTIRVVTQTAEGAKRTVSVSVSKGNNTTDKSLPEFENTYTRPVEETPPPPTTPPTPVEEPPTVLGALRSIPEVLGAMRDQIMTGDTSALTIATLVFAATCVGLAIILANNRKKHENEDSGE